MDGIDVLTDRVGSPSGSSPVAARIQPGAFPTRSARSACQRRLELQQRLTAVTDDIDGLWRESLATGDFELVTSTVEASQAVHRAILALGGGRIGGLDG